MNQLETNLILWAICAILLFELLVVICVCRCFFNRIKAKRFYVKVNDRVAPFAFHCFLARVCVSRDKIVATFCGRTKKRNKLST